MPSRACTHNENNKMSAISAWAYKGANTQPDPRCLERKRVRERGCHAGRGGHRDACGGRSVQGHASAAQQQCRRRAVQSFSTSSRQESRRWLRHCRRSSGLRSFAIAFDAFCKELEQSLDSEGLGPTAETDVIPPAAGAFAPAITFSTFVFYMHRRRTLHGPRNGGTALD